MYELCVVKTSSQVKVTDMSTIKSFAFLSFWAFVLFSSCTSRAKFPVSTIAPAAEISAEKKLTKNNNYDIKVTVDNLAEASRLNPPKNNYSVWIVTEQGETKNIGQLSFKNGRRASLNTTTAFNGREIFITAENQPGLTYPAVVEISRTTFNK